jgi:hypothetical protein
MPHSVEMPAPVKGTIRAASAIMLPSCSTPLRKSLAITVAGSEWLGRADYSTDHRIARSMRPAGCAACASSCCPVTAVPIASRGFGDLFFRLPRVFGLLRLRHRCAFRLLHRLAVLGQLFQFRFEFARRAATFSNSVSVAFSRRLASSSMLSEFRSIFANGTSRLFPSLTGTRERQECATAYPPPSLRRPQAIHNAAFSPPHSRPNRARQ